MRLGEHFREVRIQRGIQQKELVSDNLSAPALSLFENGKSDLAFERAYQAITDLGISFEEFQSTYEELDRPWSTRLLIKRISKAFYSGSVAGLESVRTDLATQSQPASHLEERRLRLLSICAGANIQRLDPGRPLPPTELSEALHYLDQTKSWSNLELFITQCITDCLNEERLIDTFDLVFNRRTLFSTSSLTYSISLLALHDLVNAALSLGDTSILHRMISALDSLPLRQWEDVGASTLFAYDRGWYHVLLGRVKTGLDEMRRVEQILTFLGYNDAAEGMRKEILEVGRWAEARAAATARLQGRSTAAAGRGGGERAGAGVTGARVVANRSDAGVSGVTGAAGVPGAVADRRQGATATGGAASGVTGATVPGGAAPGTIPGASAPDAATPGAAVTRAVPGVAIPRATVPTTRNPGATVSGASAPGAAVPGVAISGAVIPGASAASAKTRREPPPPDFRGEPSPTTRFSRRSVDALRLGTVDRWAVPVPLTWSRP